MILYYTGTGNTRHAALTIAALTGDRAVSITEAGKDGSPSLADLRLSGDEPLGLMFPIYAWSVPPVVLEALEALPDEVLSPGRYIYIICTCGDEAGIAMRRLSRRIERRRCARPQLAASVIMPNNYVLLPGFDADPAELERQKLAAAEPRLGLLGARVKAREDGVYDVTEGSLPALRTVVVGWLFRRCGVQPRRWHASAACVGCGKCAAACPAGNIRMAPDGATGSPHPHWGAKCYSCCACFHTCPVRAIDYGRATRKKHQYLCPGTKK